MNTLEEQIRLSRKTLIEMLMDRGYITDDIVPELPESLFVKLWSTFTNESSVFDIECENNVGERIYVTYIRNHILSKEKNKKKYFPYKKCTKNYYKHKIYYILIIYYMLFVIHKMNKSSKHMKIF
jgi:hypothetical protein